MRSLLVSRLCRKSPPFLVRQLGGVRFLSKTPLCHIVGAERCGSTSRDGDIGKLVICNFSASPCGTKVFDKRLWHEEFIAPGCGNEILEKTVPMDLMTETGTIGASHGWVATLKDGVVCLQDDLNPSASDSDPKRISLPPLVTLPHCQTQLVTNVAMSSSSPEEDDCIVAVKFLGPQLSLCRPAGGKGNSDWLNIRIEDSSFFSSRVMYSKTHEMFSLLAIGGTHTRSWDLKKHMHKPKTQLWYFRTIPDFVQSEMGILDTCITTEHLVESRPTGETFIVKSYRMRNINVGGRMETRHIMVFKLDAIENAIYTDDIGDLCIFLSESEPFCLQASLYGLCKNCVYYIEKNEHGKFELESNHLDNIFLTYPAPYYIPPHS